ncbi:MFS transporter [Leucobacter chromiiresistens]|uniref:Predicted arabinose efflux permease, MFS family n=1 Tax=Leucobacter chromiiresistens TaxID=1079994 RepID=A0A1H1AF21_9MICO|nr:aromatic acid/H+ symport family MFS transporter [Leucobacter chromiiresistens]SDQ38190.1 Predicted arabinose efflux permease, MFS family [Leucobacter chromiiresistens]
MRTSSRRWIIGLCWLTVMFDGFDIVALGATIPIITGAAHGHLGATVADMTFVSTISLVGVGLGAVLIGPISERIGRRMALMLCLLVFSAFTLLFPLMPSVALMGVVRLIAGIGLGGCMPIALTMMQESAPAGRKAGASTFTMTGYHVGAVIASLAAYWAHEHWAWLFYLGGVLGLATLPIMWFRLPETRPTAVDRPSTVAEHRSGVRDLFTEGRSRATIGLWIAAFMGLLLVYGLNTWMPKIMELAGYPVSSSLIMLFVLNAGAVLGLLVGGRIGDARGVKGTTLVWFGASAVLLGLLSVPMSSVLALNLVILVTGVFVFCAQVLVYAFVGYTYPRSLVATGMGFTAGVGRLGAIAGPWITGALVTAGLAYPGGFYLFAGVAVVGLLAAAMIPKPRPIAETSEPRPVEVGG